MNFKDVITLLEIVNNTNDVGDSVVTYNETDVFADRMGVNQSEVYEAMATGIKPSVKFKIRSMDYDDQERLRYKGKVYDIVRKYDKDDEFIELTGESLVV